MDRNGYSLRADRLRPGTFTLKNLARRLLGTATVIYIQAETAPEEDEDLEADEIDEDEIEAKQKGKALIPISPGLRIPFVLLHLFPPKVIPRVSSLTSPMLRLGAIGNFSFVDKKTGNAAKPNNPSLNLSNLANVPLLKANKVGDPVQMKCWHKTMKKYMLRGKVTAFETQPLLEIDSQEKVQKIADRLQSFGK